MITHNASIVIQDKEGCSPLHHAAEVGAVDVVPMLINDFTLDLKNKVWETLTFL